MDSKEVAIAFKIFLMVVEILTGENLTKEQLKALEARADATLEKLKNAAPPT